MKHPWNKGLTKETDPRLAIISKLFKTELFEKFSQKGILNPMYGRKHTEETKRKISEIKKIYLSNPENRKNLGKSMMGKHHSEESKLKISKLTKGSNNGMYGRKHSIESRKKMSGSSLWKGKHLSEIHKQKIRENHTSRGKHRTKTVKLKIRIGALNHIKNIRGMVSPNIGKYEKGYLDLLEEILGYKIIRQYPVIGYFIDGYCKERNIAIEIDEPKHFAKIEKDILRQEEIEKILKCKFLRIRV